MNQAARNPESLSLTELTTPSLLLDRDRLRANLRRLADHIGGLGGVLRPHVKTHKSIDVAREVFAAGHAEGITVSTLKEAEYFLSAGYRDILYGVGISPNKFSAAKTLLRGGCVLTVILDTPEMAAQLAAYGEAENVCFPVLIELDTDGHRSGVQCDSEMLIDIGKILDERSGVELRGVMTHAGESYNCRTQDELRAIARQERDLSLLAAERLRDAGLDCPVVSIGSTPTAFAIDDLRGVTEVRAGVYAFLDLVMAGVGVCTLDDIALSVLVTVTGHQRDKQWLITDGGWMAMSRDRGTANQPVDYGYGAVLDAAGHRLPLLMSGANQEHGIIGPAEQAQKLDFEQYPLGSQLRILPNHACATSAQYEFFNVLEGGTVTDVWERCGGW